MTNDKFKPTQNIPKTETKIVLKSQEIKKSNLSPAARSKVINRSGSNYLSVIAMNNTNKITGYGPMIKWCFECEADKDVSEIAYKCPSCSIAFGAVSKRIKEQKQVGKKNDFNSEKFLVKLLIEKNLTLASCESLTGGLFATSLTEVAGASKVLKGGFVVYSNEAKNKLVEVSLTTLDEHGAVSEQCAKEMARNTQRILNTDLAISFTGNAGPDSQEDKPVGLVFIGLVVGERLINKSYQFLGSRKEIRQQVIEAGIELIKNNL